MRFRLRTVVAAMVTVAACESSTAGPVLNPSLLLEFAPALVGPRAAPPPIDQVRISVARSGATPVQRTATPGDTVRITGLVPASYDVRVEAWGGQILVWFAESSVNVVAGSDARATMTPEAFELAQAPTTTSPATVIEGDTVTVSWGALPSAASYRVEWSTDATFATGVQSATTTQTTLRFLLGAPAVYHVRVAPVDAALNRGVAVSLASTFTVIANTSPVVTITAPAQDTTVVLGVATTLTATASDAEDGDRTSSLTWTSSVDGALGTGRTVAPVLTSGVHTIAARVLDSKGVADADTVVVTVNGLPTLAISEPSADTTVTSGDAVTLTATAGDPEDGDLSGAITWSSNLAGVLGTGGTITPMLSPGIHAVVASVTDGASASVADTVVVTVNTRPVLTITAPAQDTTVALGDATTLTATASDAEDGDLTSSVSWTSSVDGALGSGGTVSPTLSAGVHAVVATVQDGIGAMRSDTVTVAVVPNPPPIAAFSYDCDELACTFTDGSTDNGSIVSWDWDFGDGATSTLPSPGHTYATGATYAVRLIVVDDEAVADTLTLQVAATMRPVVTITAPSADTTVTEGDAVALTATATDVEDGNLTASVSWTSSLSGALGTGGAVAPTLAVGTHAVVATVTDGAGSSAADTVVVTVNARPVVTITAPSADTTVVLGDATTLTATASDAEDGSLTASVSWTSSLDGALGTGATVTPTLTAGVHSVIAAVTDGVGAAGADTVVVTVSTRPVVTITAPSADTAVASGDAVTLTATASDAEDGDLTASVSWTSSLSGALGTGGTIAPTLAAGTHAIVVSVTDGVGISASDTVVVTASGNLFRWINASGGAWSDAASWNRNQVPGPTATVEITLDGTYTVTVDGDVTVAGLVLGAGTGTQTLEAIGRTIAVGGRVDVLGGGEVSLTGGSLAAIRLNQGGSALFTADAATVDVDTVATSAGATFRLTNSATVVGRFENGAGATLEIGPGTSSVSAGLVQNGALRIVASTGNATLTQAQSFTNAGTIELAGTSFLARHLQSGGTLTNTGVIRVAEGSHQVSAQLTNTGTVRLDGGNLTVTPTTTFTTTGGTLEVAAGDTLTVSGGTTVVGSGTTLTGTGLINLAGSATLSVPTAFVIPNGGPTWTFGGTVTVNGAGSLTNRGELTLSGDVVNAALVNDTTGVLRVVPGTSTFGGAVTQVGSLRVIGGASAAGLTVTSGFTNGGTIQLTNDVSGGSSTLTVSTGTLVNAPGGTLAVLSGAGGGTRTLAAGTLDHRGSLTLERPLSVSGQLVVPGTAAATVTGNGSVLTVSGLDVDGLVLDSVPLVSSGGTITRFDDVTFQSMDPAVTQLTITHPGTAAPFTFDGVQFLTTPTTGRYIAATDSGTPANVFTINFANSAPADGFPFTTVAGGAVVNWLGTVVGSGVSWINSGGGNWSNPANWSGGSVPTALDTARIELSGTYTVTLDIDATVARLTLGGGTGTKTLTASGRVLTVNDGGEVLAGGVLSLTSSTLNGSSQTIAGGGLVQLAGSTISPAVTNAGTVRVEASGVVSAMNGLLTTTSTSVMEFQPVGNFSAVLTMASGFTNQGSIAYLANISGGIGQGWITVTSGTLVNAATGTIDVDSYAGTITGALDNQGTILLDRPLTINAGSGALANSGTITGTQPLSLTAGSLVNSGSVTTTSTLTVSGAGSLDNTGTLSVNGGTVTLTGAGAGLTTSGSLDVGDTKLTVVGGPFAWTAGTITGADTLHLSGLTATFTPDLDVGGTGPIGLQLTNATLNGAGQTVTSGGALQLSASTISPAVTNAGTVRVEASGVVSAMNGLLTTTSTSVMEFQPVGNSSAVLTMASGFTNQGSIAYLANTSGGIGQGWITVTSGTLVNAATGTIDVDSYAGTIAGALDNQGTILLDRPLTINAGTGAVANSGTITGTQPISVTAGAITNSGSVTTTSTLTVSGAASLDNTGTLSVNGGTVTLTGAGAGLTTSGSLDVGDTKLTVVGGPFAWTAGTITGADTLHLSGLTATFTPTMDLGVSGPQGLELTNTTLSGPELTNSTGAGALVMSGSVLNTTAPLVNGAGGVVQLTGATIVPAVENQGTLRALPSARPDSIQGALTTTAGSTMELLGPAQGSGVNMVVSSGFTNNGVLRLITTSNITGVTLTLTSGTLTNAVGATMEVSTYTTTAATINASFDNQGSMTTAGTFNPGVLNVNAGTGTVTNSGTITGTAMWTVTATTFTNSGTMEVNGAVTVSGQLIVPNTDTGTFTGNGSLLTVAGLDVDGAVFDNVPLTSTGGTISAFDNVTFQNMATTATQLTVSHPGAVSAFTFDNVDFLTTPTTGRYLQATDSAADANTLTVTMTNPTPASGAPYVATSGGAVVNWP